MYSQKKENDNDYLKELCRFKSRCSSFNKILIQVFFQGVISVVVGFAIEWGWRNQLQHDDTDPDAALFNAQLIASFFAGLITTLVKKAINKILMRYDRRNPGLSIYMGAYDNNDIKTLMDKERVHSEAIMTFANEKIFAEKLKKDWIKYMKKHCEKTSAPLQIALFPFAHPLIVGRFYGFITITEKGKFGVLILVTCCIALLNVIFLKNMIWNFLT